MGFAGRIVRLALFLVLLAGCVRARGRDTVGLGIPAGLREIEPYLQYEEYALTIAANAYDALIEYDRDLVVRGGLAASWENTDEHTWTFRIRPGIQLHDGRLLQAGHVAAAFRKYVEHPRSAFQSFLADVESVEATGPLVVVIRTRNPVLSVKFADIPLAIESAVPGGPPVGKGPYRFRDRKPDGSVRLEAVAGHWRGPVPIRVLDFRVVPDPEARMAALRRGELDLIVDVPASEMDALDADPRLRSFSRHGVRVMLLGMDCSGEGGGRLSKKNPISDRRVRRAIALAIDRSGIVRGALGGRAEVADQIVVPEIFGFAKDQTPIAFDPAESRRLLREAGVHLPLTIRMGFPIQKYRAVAEVAEAIATDLRSVGILVQPEPHPFARLDELAGHGLGLWIVGWMTTSEAELSYAQLLHSPVGRLGRGNRGQWADPEVDRLLDAVREQVAPRQRLIRLEQVAARVRDEVPVLPLYRQFDLYAADRRLEFAPRLDRRLLGWEMRWKP